MLAFVQNLDFLHWIIPPKLSEGLKHVYMHACVYVYISTKQIEDLCRYLPFDYVLILYLFDLTRVWWKKIEYIENKGGARTEGSGSLNNTEVCHTMSM